MSCKKQGKRVIQTLLCFSLFQKRRVGSNLGEVEQTQSRRNGGIRWEELLQVPSHFKRIHVQCRTEVRGEFSEGSISLSAVVSISLATAGEGNLTSKFTELDSNSDLGSCVTFGKSHDFLRCQSFPSVKTRSIIPILIELLWRLIEVKYAKYLVKWLALSRMDMLVHTYLCSLFWFFFSSYISSNGIKVLKGITFQNKYTPSSSAFKCQRLLKIPCTIQMY